MGGFVANKVAQAPIFHCSQNDLCPHNLLLTILTHPNLLMDDVPYQLREDSDVEVDDPDEYEDDDDDDDVGGAGAGDDDDDGKSIQDFKTK